MSAWFFKKCPTVAAVLLCTAVWALAGPAPAVAADMGGAPEQKYAAPPSAPDKWRISAEPYAWLIGFNGSTSVRGHRIDIDKSFIDLAEDNNIVGAWMGFFEARRGPFAVFADVVWADLDFSGNIQRSGNPIANLNILVSASADLNYELTIVQPGVAIEVARWTNGASTTAVDLMGSARYWNQSVDVSARVSATISLPGIGFQASGSRAIGRSGTLDWWDPVVGTRVKHKTASGSELTFIGDIGGFGVGSEFSWQAFGTYGRDTSFFGIPVHAVIGYRALSFDYDEAGPFGGSGVDAILHGPVIGAKFRW